jgi:hypothetical protein
MLPSALVSGGDQDSVALPAADAGLELLDVAVLPLAVDVIDPLVDDWATAVPDADVPLVPPSQLQAASRHELSIISTRIPDTSSPLV